MKNTRPDPKVFEIPSRDTYKLENIRRVAAELNNPERGRTCVLVAGTNGKGSICAFLTALLIQKGLKVGTFSSPHIVHPEERIRIQGRPISRTLLRRYESKYRKDLQDLTFFERWTMLAFLIFRDQKVDIQLLEVGMGGRLDATNISEPDLSLITTIGYDHQEVLGNSLTEIAAEKAGIMRLKRPVVILPQVPEAKKALKESALKTKTSMTRFIKVGDRNRTEENILKSVRRSLGLEQSLNARLCLHALDLLNLRGPKLSSHKIKRVFCARNLWPARLQWVHQKPVFFLDGAHNENSAKTLSKYLRQKFKGKKFSLIFGSMRDKEISAVISALRPFVREVIAPHFYLERQMDPQTNLNHWRAAGIKDLRAVNSVALALKILWPRGHKPVKDCLVAGSFYLAGSVLKALENRGEKLKDQRQ